MTKARQLADLLDASGDVSVGALDNVPPSNDASALTTGTLPVDRVPYVGRRNLIINGGFDVWQRGTSFNNNVGYTADRWIVATYASDWSSAPATLTKEMLSSPLPDGYQGTYAQYAMQPSSAYFYSRQKVENVRTLGGKTVTLSFWAKVDSGTMGINIDIQNNHGSGGSPDTSTGSNWLTATDTWTKHTLTLNVPSIDGKTIGDNSYSHVWIKSDNGTCANKTFQITQVQLELGSVATPFEHRSYGEELALCQRYYLSFGSANWWLLPINTDNTGGYRRNDLPFPVQMRARPTMTANFQSDNGTPTNTGFDSADWGNLDWVSIKADGAPAGCWCYVDYITADAEL